VGHFRLSCPPLARPPNVGYSRDSGGTVHGQLFVGPCHEQLGYRVIVMQRPHSTPSCPLKRRLHAAVFPEGYARLLQVEFPLDTPSSFVGDLALSEQLVNVFALGGDQF
jgi:hypothetical protein